MALTEKLTAIGDAIRSKTGGSDLLTLDEMPQEIQSIQTGGGEDPDTSLADSILDGTITSYSSDNLTKIKEYGFYRITSLQSVNCPNVNSLGDSTFFSCSNLNQLNLDWDNITNLPSSVFNGCQKLNLSSFPNVTTAGDSCIAGLGATSLDFPKLSNASAWTALGGNSTSSRQFLEKIRIGAKCTFGYGSFRYQGKLSAVILESDSLCVAQNSNLFDSTPIEDGTGYIYVPQALIEQYKVATNWVTFASQFRAIEDYPEICGGDA